MLRLARDSFVRAGRRYARTALDAIDRVGWRQPEADLEKQSSEYWNQNQDEKWELDSHWRGPFADRWDSIGKESLEIAQRLARILESGLPSGRTVEWGAGGGANAIHFAPLCDEFVAVDIVERTLEECARQVRSVCDTPVSTTLIPVEEPEAALSELGEGSCALFLCFYVMELVPSPEYGLRIMSIASRLLRPGGVAVVQIKYSNWDRLSRPRRRSYKRGLADMTTYPVDEFWVEVGTRGLTPVAVSLVPQNALDRRYAYFLLTKDTESERAEA
jgi:hypothetical protein